MANFTPTAEQEEIVQAALTGKDLIVQAFAGAAKSSTLQLIAEAMPTKRILYVAFNKAIATEASEKMPKNVTCKTVHSVAYANVDRAILNKLNGKRNDNHSLVKELGVNGFEAWDDVLKETIWLSPLRLMGWVNKTVLFFMQSSDDVLSFKHVYVDSDYKHLHMEGLKDNLFEAAKLLWAKYINTSDKSQIIHDVYLKLFGLSGKDLGYDVVMVDESADVSGVMLSICVAQKSSQRIYVGDNYQKIYSFTGSVDITKLVDAQVKYLTKSFRFGNGVADVANHLLQRLGAVKPLVGNGSETTFDCVTPDAIICRTNGGVLQEYIQAVELYPSARINITCDTAKILSFAEGLKDLEVKGKTYHQNLRLFKSPKAFYHWLKTTEEDVDLEVSMLASLCKKVGVNNILSTLRGYEQSYSPTMTITTAHKSKGLEWDNVRLSSDFPVPKTENMEEFRLFYVACTRAKKNLDGLNKYKVDGLFERESAEDVLMRLFDSSIKNMLKEDETYYEACQL